VVREPNPGDWVIVGAVAGASRHEAHAAYLARAVELHPDHHPDLGPADRAALDRAMAGLNEAWDRLERWFDAHEHDHGERVAEPAARVVPPPPPPPPGFWVPMVGGRTDDGALRLVGSGDDLFALASVRGAAYRTLRCTDRPLRPEQLVAAIDALPGLRSLDLDGTGLGDVAVHALMRLPALTELHLAETEVTDAALPLLATLGRLATLSLAFTAVTDRGIEHLRGHPRLTVLNLRGTEVEGPGLAALATCPSLRLLSLPHVDRHARRALADACPHLVFA
jgi:hypothetical protein